mmetsp:Transcript_43265/g.123783  ORF Transcript_43265/g.123783 Transcript_43265/m.123783 type:complete len:269 (-) Transcript_43265:896-1702(-)
MSWLGRIMSLTSRRSGAVASRAGSPNDSRGVQTNFTVNLSVGILEGRLQCSKISVPPPTGEAQGSTCAGPSLGQRVIQSTMEPKSAQFWAWRIASNSPLKCLSPVCMLDFFFADVFSRGLAVMSRSAAVGALVRSGVQVKPPSMEIRSCTAAVVVPCSTTQPRGDCATSGVMNSTVSTSTILPGTTTSKFGAEPLSRTITGMVSWMSTSAVSLADLFLLGLSKGSPVTKACTTVPPCEGAKFGSTRCTVLVAKAKAPLSKAAMSESSE